MYSLTRFTLQMFYNPKYILTFMFDRLLRPSTSWKFTLSDEQVISKVYSRGDTLTKHKKNKTKVDPH